MLSPIVEGLFTGLSVAAPFGPVSLLCVQRSLVGGPHLGFASGAGAATAHGAFASLAVCGADVIATHLTQWQQSIHLTSAVILIALGTRTLLKRGPAQSCISRDTIGKAFLTTLMLALFNPMTILPYLAIASALTMETSSSVGSSALMVVSVMLGATCWYAVLSSGASVFRHAFTKVMIGRLNLGAGAAMIGFGIIVGLR